MCSILRHYLSRELLQYWLVITLLLWLVLVAARFSLYLGQAASGRLPADLVLLLLGLKSVGFFVFLLPLTLFLALLWLLGRLNRDHESLALGASGAGPRQIYRAVRVPVVLALVAVAVLSVWLVPQTARYGYEVRARAEQKLDVDALVAGRFHELRSGRWLVFAERAGAAPGSLENVFVHIRNPQAPQVLVAERARIEGTPAAGDRYLVLSSGTRYDGLPGQGDYRVLRYREYAIRMQDDEAVEAPHKWDAVASSELWSDPSAAATAEFHKRLSRPVTVLVLVLIAVPLARFRPGLSRYYPLWMGVLLFTLYFNLLGTAQLWIEQGRVPGWLGLWWVHAVPLGLVGGWGALQRWWQYRRAVS